VSYITFVIIDVEKAIGLLLLPRISDAVADSSDIDSAVLELLIDCL